MLPQARFQVSSTGLPLGTAELGSSRLTYSQRSDQYHLNWTTIKNWKGTCRQLTVRLADGTDHAANFQFG